MRNLVALLVPVLLFLMATSTQAAAVGYLDILAGGVVEQEAQASANGLDILKDGEYGLDITLVSAGTMLSDRIKIGAEYGGGRIKKIPREAVSLWSVKVGYRLVDKLAFKLDAMVAPLIIDTENSMLRTTLGGLEAIVYFSTKLFFNVSYVLGNATYEQNGLNKDQAVPISFFRTKLHYFLTENWGAVAGYSWLKYEFNVINPALDLGKMEVGFGGPTLGLIYKF